MYKDGVDNEELGGQYPLDDRNAENEGCLC